MTRIMPLKQITSCCEIHTACNNHFEGERERKMRSHVVGVFRWIWNQPFFLCIFCLIISAALALTCCTEQVQRPDAEIHIHADVCSCRAKFNLNLLTQIPAINQTKRPHILSLIHDLEHINTHTHCWITGDVHCGETAWLFRVMDTNSPPYASLCPGFFSLTAANADSLPSNTHAHKHADACIYCTDLESHYTPTRVQPVPKKGFESFKLVHLEWNQSD